MLKDFLSKSFSVKFIFIIVILLFLLLLALGVNAQQNNNQILTQKQKDQLYLKRSGVDFIAKLKIPLEGKLKGILSNLNGENISLIGGLVYAKQTILSNNYPSVFNYDLSDINQNIFKLGWLSGLRINNDNFIFEILCKSMNTGTYYKQYQQFSPYYLGGFSNFKAENHFINFNISPLYKNKIILIDPLHSVLSFVVGPSIDIRVNEQNNDNLLRNNYNRFQLSGKVGIEFESEVNYTLFIHYNRNITPFTKSPIHVNLNSFSIGAAIKINKIL